MRNDIVSRKEEILQWIRDSNNTISNSEIALRLGTKIVTWNRYNKLLGINYRGNGSHKNTVFIPDAEMFKENSTFLNSTVRRALLNKKLKKYECAKCNQGTLWQNAPLTLELHHKNGVRTDHRLDNLEFLCPNCHSQTPSFKGKQNTGVQKISDEEIITSLNKWNGNVSRALRENNLSGSGNYMRISKLKAQLGIEQERNSNTWSRTECYHHK